MWFLKQSAGAAQEDENAELAMKIWQTLEGEKRNGIHPENLKAFTAAIMKIMLNPEVQSSNRYGTFSEDGRFGFSQAQATRIHKDFILFYLNRTAYSSSSTVPKSTEEAEYTFKPSLCEHSVTLANTVREKHGGKDESVVSRSLTANEHVEMLSQAQKDQESYGNECN